MTLMMRYTGIVFNRAEETMACVTLPTGVAHFCMDRTTLEIRE